MLLPRESSSLAGLQSRMSAALRWPAEREGESEAIHLVRPPGDLTPAEALGIYRKMMRTRFKQTMADAYPAVQRAVGVDEFDRLERGYLRAFPPHSFTLARLGDRFSLYLSRQDPRPWLSELAELEHAVHELAQWPDDRPLEPVELARVSANQWGNVRLVPIRGLRLISVDYNVDDLFDATRRRGPMPLTARREACLVLYLRAGSVKLLQLPEHGAELLRALIGGAPLAEAIEQVLAEGSEVQPTRIFEWMRDWASRGLFRAIISS